MHKKNVLINIYQALCQIYEADSRIVWFTFFKNIFEAVFEAVYGIYLIKFIYECIENRVDFQRLFIMVSAFCIFYIVVHLISVTHSYCEKISELRIYRHIFQKIIQKAKKIKISQYENPKFYDEFSRALDEALEQGFGGLFTPHGEWGVSAEVL